ncbi:MAG: hypothetical protein MUO53_06790, partial [Maribacter sp.]|nr:hypothetical protein [Maribacter sp.]
MSLRFLLLSIGFFLTIPGLVAQEAAHVEGTVLDSRSKKAITDGIVRIEGLNISEKIGIDGAFSLFIDQGGDHILNISSPDYITKRIPIIWENKP